jgi:hypothetical protein
MLKSTRSISLSGGFLGSNPEQLRWLAAWLHKQEVEEVVMESTAQYWKPVWEAERYWKPICQKREGAHPKSGSIWRRRSRTVDHEGVKGISPMPNG